MVKTPPRYFRIQMTVPSELMEIIFDLIKGEDAHDVKMIELSGQRPDNGIPLPPMPQGATVGPTHTAHMRAHRTGLARSLAEMAWIERAWPAIKPIFEQANGTALYYADERLLNAVTSAGYRVTSITPLLSGLARFGYITRVAAGTYKLP